GSARRGRRAPARDGDNRRRGARGPVYGRGGVRSRRRRRGGGGPAPGVRRVRHARRAGGPLPAPRRRPAIGGRPAGHPPSRDRPRSAVPFSRLRPSTYLVRRPSRDPLGRRRPDGAPEPAAPLSAAPPDGPRAGGL